MPWADRGVTEGRRIFISTAFIGDCISFTSVPAAKIHGPYDGQLDNAGERLEISMPGDIDMFGRQYYIRIDKVTYSDGAHPGNEPGNVDLWPAEADGDGASLTRITPHLYGNDPNNWTPQPPTPAAP